MAKKKRMPTFTSHGLRINEVRTGGLDLAVAAGGTPDVSAAPFNRSATSSALLGRLTGSLDRQAATVSSQLFGIAAPSIPSSALRAVIEGGISPFNRALISPA